MIKEFVVGQDEHETVKTSYAATPSSCGKEEIRRITRIEFGFLSHLRNAIDLFGDSESFRLLAEMASKGMVLSWGERSAIEKSCEFRNASSCFFVGFCTFYGCFGFKKDREKAITLLQTASLKGHGYANFMMAEAMRHCPPDLFTWHGIVCDIATMIQKYEAAVEENVSDACLGSFFSPIWYSLKTSLCSFRAMVQRREHGTSLFR